MLLGWALAAWIGGSFVCCVVADVLLRPVLHDAATRYYLLHAIVNAAEASSSTTTASASSATRSPASTARTPTARSP